MRAGEVKVGEEYAACEGGQGDLYRGSFRVNRGVRVRVVEVGLRERIPYRGTRLVHIVEVLDPQIREEHAGLASPWRIAQRLGDGRVWVESRQLVMPWERYREVRDERLASILAGRQRDAERTSLIEELRPRIEALAIDARVTSLRRDDVFVMEPEAMRDLVDRLEAASLAVTR